MIVSKSQIKSVKIKRVLPVMKDACEGWNAGAICFTFTMERGCDSSLGVDIIGYSADLYVMGRNARQVELQKRNRFQIRMNSSYIWMPGDYFFLIFLDGELNVRVNVRISEDNSCKASLQNIPSNSADYWLGHYLCTNAIWKNLSVISGLSTVMHRLLQQYSRVVFNRYRSELGLTDAPRHGFYVLIGKEELYMKAAARYLDVLLHDGDEDYLYQQADELIDERAAYREENSVDTFFSNLQNHVIVLTGLSSLLIGKGGEFLQRLEENLLRNIKHRIVLAGSKLEVEKLFELSPGLAAFFPEENRMQASLIL